MVSCKIKPSSLVFSAILALNGLFIPKVWAENPCAGKPDSEVRLDQKGKSLENSEILDQDSLGVCYATAASTALQSALPGNPDISYLDYALQYKKGEYNGKSVKIMNPNPKDPGTILDGGYMCAEFEDIKKKGVCPREKINLETISAKNPDLQIESFRGIGSFFDLQKNSTPEKRKITAKAILNGIEKAREGAKEECTKFPSNMKKFLGKIYDALKKSIDTEKMMISNDLKYTKPRLLKFIDEKNAEKIPYQKKIEELKIERKEAEEKHASKMAKIDKNKNNLINQLVKNRPERMTQKEEFKFKEILEPIDRNIRINELDISVIDIELRSKKSELEDILKQEKKIADLESTLSKLGKEVPDTNSKTANATKLELSEEVLKKLETDYREAVSKIDPNHWRSSFMFEEEAKKLVQKLGVPMTYDVNTSFWGAGSSLEGDAMQLNPDRCFRKYVSENCETLKKTMKSDMNCGDPALAEPAVKMISSLNALIHSKANDETLVEKMGSNPYAFIEELIGSTCEAKDRIKIPSSLRCNTHSVLDVIFNSSISKPFESEVLTQKIGKQLRADTTRSVKNGRAVLLSVCADMFDSSRADSDYGWGCNSGAHAVALIGYRCKAGKTNYLIQNSWGSYGGPYDAESEHNNGRVWVPERLVIRNMMNYGTFDGGTK